ncbi:22590_t:CDS:2, partial [Gigaspora margarita]
NTPRVTAVKVPITETAEAIIIAAQSRYGPEISQYPSIELTLVDSGGEIVDPTLDIEDITTENSQDDPFKIKLNNRNKILEDEISNERKHNKELENKIDNLQHIYLFKNKNNMNLRENDMDNPWNKGESTYKVFWEVQIFVFVKDLNHDNYYPSVSTFRNQYEVDQFLGLNRFQLVDRYGSRTDDSLLTRRYKDLVKDSYYLL